MSQSIRNNPKVETGPSVKPWDHEAHDFVDELKSIIDTRLLHFENGEEVSLPDAGAGLCFVVIRGRVDDCYTAEDGRYTIGQVYRVGHVIFPDRATEPGWDHLSRVSVGKSAIGAMQAHEFWRLLNERPVLSQMLLKQKFEDLGGAISRLVDNNLVPIRERIRRELLRRLETADTPRKNHIWIKSHEQFAAYMGVNRETVSRELSTLARAGAIQTSRGIVKVLDVDRLRQAGKET